MNGDLIGKEHNSQPPTNEGHTAAHQTAERQGPRAGKSLEAVDTKGRVVVDQNDKEVLLGLAEHIGRGVPEQRACRNEKVLCACVLGCVSRWLTRDHTRTRASPFSMIAEAMSSGISTWMRGGTAEFKKHNTMASN